MLKGLILLFLVTFSYAENNKKVILIGVDGFNPSCIKNASEYNNLQWMRDNGSSTNKARTIIQAWSAPGWTSISCAMDPVDTGIIDNKWVAPWNSNHTEPITPVTGLKQSFPCIFKTIKDQNPSLKTRFYFDWGWLANLENSDYANSTYIDDLSYCKKTNGWEQVNCEANFMRKILNNIETGDNADFFFFYIGGLDQAGHEKSWCGNLYEHYIGTIDAYIGIIKEKLQSKNLLNSTYIILTSDHGGRPGEFNHGEQNDSNLLVPFYIVGPNIKKGLNLDGIHNIDTAPTVLKLLGLKKTNEKFWRGRVLEEIFEQEKMKFLEDK